MTTPLLEVRGLDVQFGPRRSRRTVVQDVSFSCSRGTVTALVGESGSGKSTIARSVVGLNIPSAGKMLVEGIEVPWKRKLGSHSSVAQMVFQDPYATLDPTLPVWRTITEPLEISAGGRRHILRSVASELLEQVSLDPSLLDRRPAEFSGGQRQRIAIARALSAEPRLLVCDEAVSALDVTTQAQIVRLLEGLRRDRDLGLLFISHDLNTVKEFAHNVLVLNHGRIVEQGTPSQIFDDPQNEYTKRLIASIPSGAPEYRKRRFAPR